MPGPSFPSPPHGWHHPLTCSFSEYGLLRTTGTLPFPHRSLKTRSFSTPRGSGLCDLLSRSLKGKAEEVRTVWSQEWPASCPGLEIPSHSTTSVVHPPGSTWSQPALGAQLATLLGSPATGGKAAPWTSLWDGHAMGFAPPQPLPHFIDLKNTGSPSPCRTPGQSNGHQT